MEDLVGNDLINRFGCRMIIIMSMIIITTRYYNFIVRHRDIKKRTFEAKNLNNSLGICKIHFGRLDHLAYLGEGSVPPLTEK